MRIMKQIKKSLSLIYIFIEKLVFLSIERIKDRKMTTLPER